MTKMTGIASGFLAVYLFTTYSLIHTAHHDIDAGSQQSQHHGQQAVPSTPNNVDAKTADAKTDEVKPVEVSQQCRQILQHFQSIRNEQCDLIEPQYLEPPHVNVNTEECTFESDSKSTFFFDRERAEAFLKEHGPESIRKVITAYIEPPLEDTLPGTGSRGDLTKKEGTANRGTPPQFKVPLPLRKHTPQDLQKKEYPRVQTCHDVSCICEERESCGICTRDDLLTIYVYK
jgi:hypothetical protein